MANGPKVADEGEASAFIDEFGDRHPELRSELLRRMDMVKGLRGEKKRTVEPKKSIPRFVPKESARKSLEARVADDGDGGLTHGALGSSSFFALLRCDADSADPIAYRPKSFRPRLKSIQPPQLRNLRRAQLRPQSR